MGVNRDLCADLTNEGWIGAIQAVDRYKDDCKCSLETFANFRIRGAMLDALRALDKCHRSHRKSIKSGLNESIVILEINEKHSIVPSNEKNIISNLDIVKTISDCSLTVSETIALKSYFFCDKKMKDIGNDMGLSEGRVSQLVKSAIGKLRSYLKINPWTV